MFAVTGLLQRIAANPANRRQAQQRRARAAQAAESMHRLLRVETALQKQANFVTEQAHVRLTEAVFPIVMPVVETARWKLVSFVILWEMSAVQAQNPVIVRAMHAFVQAMQIATI